MAENGDWRKMLQDQRLQHQLEIQSRQIESVLSRNEVEAQVQGGFVQSRSIRFDLSSHLEAGLGRLRFLKQEILNALGVADVEIEQNSGRWHLHVKRTDDPPVSLLDMLPILPELPPLTVPLGMSEEGTPLLIELSDTNIPHILISGDENAGKSSLLRTIALSLALMHKQSQLQLAVIGASRQDERPDQLVLSPLSYLPHMLSPVTHDREMHQDLLEFLLSELEYRQEQNMSWPQVIVLIDEVTHLIKEIGTFASESITALLQRGPAVGIHLIMTAMDIETLNLNRNIRLNLPLHLLGKSKTDEQMAMSVEDSPIKAEYLLGKGDFIAVYDNTTTHFQAAYIGDYDLHLTLEMLHRNRPKPLLAHTYLIGNDFTQKEKVDITLIHFEKGDNGVLLEDDSDDLRVNELNE